MATTALIAVGVGLSIAGTATQLIGQQGMTNALKKAESARQMQLTLDTKRANLKAIRQGIVQRAMAEFNANAQGAQGGSGLAGGTAQVTGDVGRTTLANNQNESLSNTIFSANQSYYSASGVANAGEGLSSLGGLFMTQAGTINKVGSTAVAAFA